MFRDILGNSWVVDGRMYLFPIFYKFGYRHITCSLQCMNFSISKYVYLLDFGLDQYSRMQRYFNTDCSKAVLLWWFLIVTCY